MGFCTRTIILNSVIMKKILFPIFGLLGLLSFSLQLNAQETFPRNGVADHREGLYAFTNATIYKSYNEKLENATLIIRDGKVEAVGQGIRVPQDAVVIDVLGKTIYPSFIDLYSNYGMPEVKAQGSRSFRSPPQMLSKKKGAYLWNQSLQPEFHSYEHFSRDDKAATAFRKLGFGVVLTHKMDGISRGSSTLVTLGNEREHEGIIKEQVAHQLSFQKGTSTQNYPSSLMGGIALLRQTYYDGQWYEKQGHLEEVNISLEAWNEMQHLKQIFAVGDKLEALRAAKLGKEFGITYIIEGSGDEYQRLENIKKTGSAFILPLNYPEAFDVEDPYDAESVSLAQMKHWELAPTNPGRLANAGIDVALTTYGLKKKADFMGNLRKAIEQGLSEEAALKALTDTPARLAGASAEIGSLEKGKLANFMITNGNVFDKKTKIYQNWIKGKAFVFKDLDTPSLNGVYTLTLGKQTYNLKVSGEDESPKMEIEINDSTKIKVKHKYSHGRITLTFTPPKEKQLIRLTGTVGETEWTGKGQLGNGDWVSWKSDFQSAASEEEGAKKEGKKGEKKKETAALGEVVYPFGAYGWKEMPKKGTYLLKNATLWTNESEGIIQNGSVLIQNGKIVQVGKDLKAPQGSTVIDCTGKHITPGIIDEHSHIAGSRGINEGSQASSAEVRIGDILNSEDINIYRQLSGGVTTSQILHGSANPIGGQSAIIKLRWGFAPEELKVKNADPFIKFALGENVKQSNWGDNQTVRFPQTRMGVEQVYEDYFTEAEEYGALIKSGKPYRKDLELDALLEILEGKRFITCHSYRQSEINMLMKVAERHGFRVNTFTHILEGYKVADKMREHGAGAGTFSDWWAYKFEVYEAIPYNGAMMHDQGVTVAFNSDDAEQARRLNQEAAKAVLFGGISEEEALKFVTLNPAKLLHLDDRTGSLKAGKDADVVVWSDNPLSVYAKAEMTFVDGMKLFDRQQNMELEKDIQKERNRLIQKMLAAKKNGDKMQKPNGKRPRLYHCEDVEDEMR